MGAGPALGRRKNGHWKLEGGNGSARPPTPQRLALPYTPSPLHKHCVYFKREGACRVLVGRARMRACPACAPPFVHSRVVQHGGVPLLDPSSERLLHASTSARNTHEQSQSMMACAKEASGKGEQGEGVRV
jgi:hypothetical protein